MMGVTNIPMLNADINRNFPDAALCLHFVFTLLIFHGTAGTHYIQYSLCNIECHAKIGEADKKRVLMKLHWIWRASPICIFQSRTAGYHAGIISGFLLAFTMSLDDFVITHFTKGPGVDTLSTKIYSEVRKGIKPEMYALSTIMFMP